MSESEYKYKFSVIIPIYNVENYLEETIQSVINQTIGFEENIQIILVNDGSPDNSEEICLKYEEMYPNNIKYIYQENAGVSAARNNGFKYAKGKYINYLDSDDKWSRDAFKKAYDMLEKNESIDVVGVRIKAFEATHKFTTLDYKFKADQIIDIYIDYDYIQLSAASAFIRHSALVGKLFDTRIKFSEDAKLLYEIILEKGKYGIISSTLYYYRRRFSSNSAINTSRSVKDWYFETMDLAYKYIFDLSKEKYGKVIPFVQYYFMYDCQWRLTTPMSECLNEQEKKEYINKFINLLREVDDYIILDQKNIYYEQKIYALSLKYGYDVRKEFDCRKRTLYFKNIAVYNIKNKNMCDIRLVNINNGKVTFEGLYTNYLPDEDVKVYFLTNNGQQYELDFTELYGESLGVTGDAYLTRKCFKTEIPLKDVKSIKLMIKYREYQVCRINLKLHKLTKLAPEIENQYLVSKDNKYILSVSNNKFIIEKNSEDLHRKKEKNYMKELKDKGLKEELRYRALYYISKKFIKKDIWIVSDRTNSANDNGMHLFKYLMKNEKKAKVYFTVSKKLAPKDYKKMKKIGPVLNHNSLKYKILFLHAKYIIASHFDEWVTNAFGSSNRYMMDLYKFDFVFLQHGVTKDDMSSFLHRFNQNIKFLATTTQKEYESILDGYGYTKDVVKLTGFARYDNLKNTEKLDKVITIMPTWRANIANSTDNNGVRAYNAHFKKTEYFSKYNDLINDERLLGAMKQYGYKGIFVVHPSHIFQAIDYDKNDTITVATEIPDYQEIFNSSSLMISDYSSVAIDFAFLKKPVIYYQFDKEVFFNQHTYTQGYYDYEKDGFGPVITDYEKCIDKIIEYMQNDCKMEKEYLERVDKFFKYNDNENCKRIHNEILSLDKQSQ